LTLDGGVVKADVLATHEHAVGLPIAVYIDTAVWILVDSRRNRRAVPGSQEAVVSARADRVLAMEDHAILVEAFGCVSTRVTPARCDEPRGVGVVPGNLQAPATIGVV